VLTRQIRRSLPAKTQETFCNTFIVESRIYRATDKDLDPLQSAEYWCGDYQGAVAPPKVKLRVSVLMSLENPEYGADAVTAEVCMPEEYRDRRPA
jgi:hypothetical protein